MKLEAHPGSGPSAAMAMAAELRRSGDCLIFSFSLSASAQTVRIPSPAPADRADGLWRTSCFEAFIRGEGDRYAELNFSPSGQWAAYAFDAYRQSMRNIDVPAHPDIVIDCELGQLSLSASVRMPEEFMRPGAPTGLSAVIEEVDGTKSYWALVHGQGPPDFHHPDCFAARLP